MKRGFSIIIGIIVFGLVWYFFIKPQDYQVRVEAKSYPSIVNIALRDWIETLEKSTISSSKNLDHIEQTISFGDSIHIYNWQISQESDTTSKLKVDIIDSEHTFMNKLKIPFTDTDFEKRSRKTVTDFIKTLNQNMKEFKITIKGKEELSSTYCACVEHKTSQKQKAMGMMESYPFLNSVLISNGIELNGVPFIKVNNWDINKRNIQFDFCYPIIKKDSMPKIKNLVYKEFIGQKSIKAIYNGNYITSDRAWYALMDYAKKKNIEVEPKPIEFFFSNPNMGGDALRWKAEIFLPLTYQNE